jgi:hypothetical protein
MLLVGIGLCALTLARVAAAQPLSVIPAPGAPQTFSVSFHSDEPHPHEGGFYDVGGFYLGGPGENPALQDEPDYLHDQKGTLTLTRTASTVTIASEGALDSFGSPVNILPHGLLDPGGPPERFVVSFNNAAACFSAMPSAIAAGASWTANLQILTGFDSLQTLPISVTAISVNGGDVTVQGTGQANLMIPKGDDEQPATFELALTAEIAGGRLRSYEEKITRTVGTQGHTSTLHTTTSITATSASPSPSPSP